MKVLVEEYKACEYIPDFRGFTPLDYAGMFKNHDVVDFLIRKIWKKIKNEMNKRKKQNKETTGSPKVAKVSKDELKKAVAQDLFTCKELLLNPVLRSNLLHWSCTLNEDKFNWRLMKKMMKELNAYPECPVKPNKSRTSLHEASINGQWKKLKVILQHINRRYLKDSTHGKSMKLGAGNNKAAVKPEDPY